MEINSFENLIRYISPRTAALLAVDVANLQDLVTDHVNYHGWNDRTVEDQKFINCLVHALGRWVNQYQRDPKLEPWQNSVSEQQIRRLQREIESECLLQEVPDEVMQVITRQMYE